MTTSGGMEKEGRRRRSSSILQVYHEPPETLEQISDQAVVPNLNANWVNAKGEAGLGREGSRRPIRAGRSNR